MRMIGTILGLPVEVFLLSTSSIFFIVTIILLKLFFSKQQDELLTTFWVFLSGMALFHVFLAIGYYLNNILFIHIGSFFAVTGSALTLRFPLSATNPIFRNLVFIAVLLTGWSIIGWMLITPHESLVMLSLVFGYMIVVTGIIVGLYTLLVGIDAKEKSTKIRCIGGSLGIISCCLIADLFVLMAEVSFIGEILMSASPLIILASQALSHKFKPNNS